eukprot:13056368-Ditylum_brightwellii.AAC.1
MAYLGLGQAQCFGRVGMASSAECNNETISSPSFLILKGIESISLGQSDDSPEENDKDYMMREGKERWAKRVHTRLSFGSVSYQYREENEKRSCDTSSLDLDESAEYSTGSIVSQSVDARPIPQAALNVDCVDSQIVNAERFLPPSHTNLANHLN